MSYLIGLLKILFKTSTGISTYRFTPKIEEMGLKSKIRAFSVISGGYGLYFAYNINYRKLTECFQ
jgi:hypothetical protein